MWRQLTRAVPGGAAVAAQRAAVGRRGLASAAAKLVDLDEEFPGVPAVTASAAPVLKVETTTLPSGVKVVSTEAGKVASVGLSVAAGSQYESAGEYGSALMLQHLAFKGTTKRSALRLLRDLESVGAAPSAAAGREAILYKVTALPEQAETALEAAFETALAPKITNYIVHDLEAAAKQDLEAFSADAKAQLTEALYEAAYGENTPLGHSFYASTHVSASTLAGFRARTFTGPSLTVVGSGVAHAQLLSWASALTESLPKGGAAPAAPSSAYVGGEARVKASADHVFVGLALPAPPKADAGALAVLAAAWQAALPACASVFVLPGLVGVTGSANPATAGSYVEGLVKVLKGTGKDVAAAKKAAKVAALASVDEALFEALATGTAAAPAAVDAVSEADVKAVHAKLWKGGLSVASLGDVSKVPKLASLK